MRRDHREMHTTAVDEIVQPASDVFSLVREVPGPRGLILQVIANGGVSIRDTYAVHAARPEHASNLSKMGRKIWKVFNDVMGIDSLCNGILE